MDLLIHRLRSYVNDQREFQLPLVYICSSGLCGIAESNIRTSSPLIGVFQNEPQCN